MHWHAAQEAGSGRINVSMTEGVTLRQALAYLYTESYEDDGVFAFDYISNELQLTGGNANDTLDDTLDKVAASIASTRCYDPQPTPVAGDAQLDGADHGHKSDSIDAGNECTCQPKTRGSSCTNAELRTNALLYILADYYQIFDLKSAAASKFTEFITVFCPYSLAAACLLVYDTAPSTALDLRKSLARALSSHAQQLVKDQAFMESVSAIPELCRDLFIEIVRQSRVISKIRTPPSPRWMRPWLLNAPQNRLKSKARQRWKL
jgi:hypothetical protein